MLLEHIIDAADNLINWPLCYSRRVPAVPLNVFSELTPIRCDGVSRWGLFPELNMMSLSQREAWALGALTRQFQPRRIFEFGTGNGFSSCIMQANCPAATVTTIDIENNFCQPAYVVESMKIETVIDNSRDMKLVAADLIFIDADHSLHGCMTDSVKALAMLEPGGTIIWHDYNLQHPGVLMTVRELARARRIYKIIGTRLALYRKPA